MGKTIPKKKNKLGTRKPVKDFKKVKAKVGKKAPAAFSATRTDFKTKRVHVPNQQGLNEKGEYVNQKHLSLSDLLGRTAHSSPPVRQEAFSGLQGLFTLHPHLLPLHLGTVLQQVLTGMLDDTRSVRKSLHKLLYCMLTKLTQGQLSPFTKLCLGYVCAAMAHLQEGIRSDSLVVLRLLIHTFKGLLWQQDGHEQLLPNLAFVLTQRTTTSTATADNASSAPRLTQPGSVAPKDKPKGKNKNKVLAVKRSRSLLLLLECVEGYLQLHPLLRTALSPKDDEPSASQQAWTSISSPPGVPTGLDRTPADTRYAGALTVAFTGPIQNLLCTRDAAGTLQDNERKRQKTQVVSETQTPLHHFASTATPLLVQAWLECLPQRFVFSSRTPQAAEKLMCLRNIASALCALFTIIHPAGSMAELSGSRDRADRVTAPSQAQLNQLISHFLLHFPLQGEALGTALGSEGGEFDFGARSWSLPELLGSINVTVAQLLVFFLPEQSLVDGAVTDTLLVPPTCHLKLRASQSDQCATAVADYVVASLQRDADLHQHCVTSQSSLLLPCLPRLLLRLLPARQSGVLKAFSSLFLACPIQSVSKRLGLHFIFQMLRGPHGLEWLRLPLTSPWIRSLPNYLEQLQGAEPSTAACILQILLDYARFGSQDFGQDLQLLQHSLVPLFAPLRAPNQAQRHAVFTRLTPKSQRQALHLLVHLPRLSMPLLKSLSMCARNQDLDVSVRIHIVETVALRQNDLPLATYLSFLLACVCAQTSKQTAGAYTSTAHAPRSSETCRISVDSFDREVSKGWSQFAQDYPLSPFAVSSSPALTPASTAHDKMLHAVCLHVRHLSSGPYLTDQLGLTDSDEVRHSSNSTVTPLSSLVHQRRVHAGHTDQQLTQCPPLLLLTMLAPLLARRLEVLDKLLQTPPTSARPLSPETTKSIPHKLPNSVSSSPAESASEAWRTTHACLSVLACVVSDVGAAWTLDLDAQTSPLLPTPLPQILPGLLAHIFVIHPAAFHWGLPFLRMCSSLLPTVFVYLGAHVDKGMAPAVTETLLNCLRSPGLRSQLVQRTDARTLQPSVAGEALLALCDSLQGLAEVSPRLLGLLRTECSLTFAGEN